VKFELCFELELKVDDIDVGVEGLGCFESPFGFECEEGM
jgi:hypothetical protein